MKSEPCRDTRRRRCAALLGLAPLLLAACAAAQAPAAAPDSAPARDAAGLHRQILETVGDAACSSQDDCRTIAIGHKACGGPEGYLVWSRAVASESRLRSLVEAYNQARRVEVQKAGRVSDCSMQADPGARCDAGRCVAAGRAPMLMK